MACGATLKRSLEFDPLHSPSQNTPKRRRCMPMTLSPSTPPTRPEQTEPSPFDNVLPKLTQEQIAANISMEIKRLQRRRQLHYQRASSPPPQEAGNSQSCTSLLSQNSLSPSKKDAPLFTFKQVTMICERMLKDRESQVREEYNSVLSSKLAEQYEAFLKFNLDMIHKSLVDSPFSYIS
ncbi:Akirin-2,Akirin-1,Uncharacterized protein C1orf108 homolog A,Uncharacterized protein C1orf108 homolog B [Acanthosepion pharaonis]|uniref:Akirin-2,Akirin-1,Uncharacterized protein C1orf108 homolog A,Uncharacterized protein C1orf108 homolog B n=1 Tax=Acanthosepion pharaonis TaxID=158019 RepID=A0A812DBG5_ACAPH|nr:Akirin-2,Akirin-1,Uncharacterized protein C1orf108 homolog A,Uncharacterized protein C1orf108 homolog B [Sepia pharaonis]